MTEKDIEDIVVKTLARVWAQTPEEIERSERIGGIPYPPQTVETIEASIRSRLAKHAAAEQRLRSLASPHKPIQQPADGDDVCCSAEDGAADGVTLRKQRDCSDRADGRSS